jgi:hypothetical protein
MRNPFAQFPIDFKKLGLKYNFIDESKIVKSEGNNLDRILNMKKRLVIIN